MEDVHQLPLVLVETLHLHVEDGIGIHLDTVMLLDIFCQTKLVPVLDLHELLLSRPVTRQLLQTHNLRQIRDPAVAHMLCHPLCQKGIAVEQEASLGDAVGLVVEAFGEHLVEVLQLLALQDLRVQPGHAVDGIARHDGHMGHFHLSVVEDCHLADLLPYIDIIKIRIFLFDLLYKPAVDLLHNLVNSGEQPGEQVNGPFLKSFRHDGMVGVGAGSGGDIPCLVPAQVVIVQEDAHQLGDGHRGMGIIELEGYLLRETVNIIMLSHIFLHSLLHGCGDEEVLLL